ncbi:MAG: glucose 1-dehydrogenase [Anaerolineae bacterium]|nr:glucose 1-dehydrogenase [Anaerolineae bacterium]
MRLDGKRALVTGAGKGIGREIVKVLTECGAEVVAISRTQSDLDRLKAGFGCSTILADLTSADGARQAAEAAGDIDLLVNNAGIALLAPFLEVTVQDFDDTIAVNLRAALIIGQVVAKGMVARGKGGAIVNVSSQAGVAAVYEHAAYCASKAGLDHLTRVMALELGPHQIRVNSVNPTVILTPMGEKVWGEPAKGDPMRARIPLGRFGYPIHVAQAVAYLLSDQADMINGIIMPIDGGFLVG